MKTVDITTTVRKDGEVRIKATDLRAGQRVEIRIVMADAGSGGPSLGELRGALKGTWASAEAIDSYLERERGEW